MKDLDIAQEEELLSDVKSFLGISWDDDEVDKRLLGFIKSSIRRIDEIAGIEFDYVDEDEDASKLLKSTTSLARELMMNRVFYLNEKGLDDFERNYRSELTSLYVNGRILKDADKESKTL